MAHVAASENCGPICRCPYNKSPTIWGSILGADCGNSHVAENPKRARSPMRTVGGGLRKPKPILHMPLVS